MARLKHLASDIEHVLSSQHVVGREARSDLKVDHPLVSSLHAELRWVGTCWEVRDLGSSNGTFVNRKRLRSGERVALACGHQVAFGDPNNAFELIDDAPPTAMATGADGRRVQAEHGMLVIPDSEHPEVTIFEEYSGWLAELATGERRAVSNRDTLAIDGQAWTLDLPAVTKRTLQPGSQPLPLRACRFRFTVSKDEEHVEIDVLHQGLSVAHLPHRAYSYMLLTLARARLKEQDSEVPSERGWVYSSELEAMLAVEAPLLHQYICRTRKALSRAGILGFADIIERRPGAKQVRFGVSDIEIVSP